MKAKAKITKEQIYKMNRQVSREEELEAGRVNHHRVFTSKKEYKRQPKFKKTYDE